MSKLYRHYDKDGTLLYVGVSGNPDKRLKQHRYASRWSELIEKMEIQKFASLKDALEAEKKAIIDERPLYNINYNDPIDADSRPPRGGAGRGQGRKAEDGACGVERVTIQVTIEQLEKVRRNGGSKWLRRLIDDACTVQNLMV